MLQMKLPLILLVEFIHKKKRFVGGVENRVTGDLELNDNPGSDAVKTEEISAT